MGNRLPQMTPREMIRAIERLGFRLVRSSGSHQSFWNPVTKRMTVIAMHSAELKRGAMFGILKQAGISEEELRRVL